MFKWLNRQGVESDKGFVVQSMNRFTIEYRESSKVIPLSVERGLQKNGQACVYIYLDELNKWADGEPIPLKKQAEILQNFKDAMEFQGIGVLVE